MKQNEKGKGKWEINMGKGGEAFLINDLDSTRKYAVHRSVLCGFGLLVEEDKLSKTHQDLVFVAALKDFPHNLRHRIQFVLESGLVDRRCIRLHHLQHQSEAQVRNLPL
jgi:hypothetical protein